MHRDDELKELMERLERLEAIVSKGDDEFGEGLQAKVEQLKDTLEELHAFIEQCEKNIEKLEERVGDEYLFDITEQIGKTDEKIDDEAKSIRLELAGVEKRREDIEYDHEGKIAEIDAAVADLRRELRSLDKEKISDFEFELMEMKIVRRADEAEDEGKQIKKRIEHQASMISSLEELLADAQHDAGVMKGEITQLNSEIVRLHQIANKPDLLAQFAGCAVVCLVLAGLGYGAYLLVTWVLGRLS
jgi:chromosome segregation ATPase